MDFHSILGKLRAIESLGTQGIDDRLHEAEDCTMTAEGEACPVHGMEECDGYQGTIQMEDSRGEMMDGDTSRDDRAERAGRKVAKDIEYDERKKDGIHGAKRGAEDNKAERAGRRVTKDIEYDEMAESKHGLISLNGKDIDITSIEIDNVDTDDYPDFSDAYISAARYADGNALTDEELERLQDDNRDLVHELAHTSIQGMEEDAPLGPPPFAGPGATNNGPDTAGYVYAYNESQKQLRESMNIVMSQNIDDQGSHKSLTVTATDEDFDKLERLLSMAGIGKDAAPEAVVVVAPQAGMPYGISPHYGNPPEEVAMENADHDFGHDEHEEDGEPLNVKDYEWNGPHINQRFGKIGDNTLMAERANSLFAALNEQYTDYLIEAELETSNSGSESPLTANARDAFDKDPFADEKPVTDGSRSPLSHIGRQDVMN